jgi:hypothetical protein
MTEDDEPTRLITRKSSTSQGSTDETIAMPGRGRAAQTDTSDQTRVFRPKRRAGMANADTPGAQDPAGAANFTSDPVVGWLVVVDGPGRGAALALGYGLNTIGRGADARLRLDFGDDQISKDNHASVTYDPRGRRYYIQHGGGVNLTYIGDDPVLQPRELLGREVIGIGQTQLVFVAFCGADFDWQDQ